MSQTFMPNLSVAVNLVQAPVAGNTSKQVLIVGQRITGGKLILAKNGFSQPNLYQPLKLGSFASGTVAVDYLSNYGLNTAIGIFFSLDLPAPSSVVPSNGQTLIQWDIPPAKFSKLVGFALSGVLSQGLLSGSVLSAYYDVNSIATMAINGTVAFDTTTVMTLTGVNNINYPDPKLSDPIALLVWDFYETALSATPSKNGTPSTYLSIINDRDNTISANPTPFEIAKPDIVTVSGTTVTLTYAYTVDDILPLNNGTFQTYISNLPNFGYIPTTAYGSSNMTQETSNATGILGGLQIVPAQSGGVVRLTITGVTGTFNTSDVINIVLDNTIDVFNFINNINLNGAVLQFPVNDITDVKITQSAFFNGIKTINQPNQVLNGHYYTYGIAGNITSLPSSGGSLPAPNNQYYVLASYPYVAQFGDIPYDNEAKNVASGRISACFAYLLANGDAVNAYPSLQSVIIQHLPVSSIANTTSYQAYVGGTGDIAVSRGWSPLAPNSQGIVSILQSVTTLITINNVPDNEFRFTHVGDCIRWTKQATAELYMKISVLPNNAGAVTISPAFIRQFKSGITGILFQGQKLGIFQNVDKYQGLVTVTADAINPTQVNAFIPCQIIPQLISANVAINVFSTLTQFQQS